MRHLHGIAGSGLIAHGSNVIGSRPDELDTMIRADVHKCRIFGQETIALRGKHKNRRRLATGLLLSGSEQRDPTEAAHGRMKSLL